MVSEVYALLFQGRVWEVYFCASEIHNECSFYLIVIDVLLRHVSTILSYLTCFSTMMLVYQEGFMLSFYKAKRCLFFFFPNSLFCSKDTSSICEQRAITQVVWPRLTVPVYQQVLPLKITRYIALSKCFCVGNPQAAHCAICPMHKTMEAEEQTLLPSSLLVECQKRDMRGIPFK